MVEVAARPSNEMKPQPLVVLVNATRWAVLVLVVAASVWSCSDSESDEWERVRAELERNRERWAERGFPDYDLTLRRLCFCPPELVRPVVVAVRDGEIASVTFTETGEPVDPEFARFFPDVEGLFDLVQDAIDRDADSLVVDYDAALGYPAAISIDYEAGIADEELSFRVDSLTPAPLPLEGAGP
jgi:hypothetical protein